MKKLIFLFVFMLFSCLIVRGQSSTITHYGTFVTINWDHGDTITVPASNQTQVYPTKNQTNVRLPDGSTYKLYPDDFSAYSTNHDLWLALAHMVHGNITVKYNAATDPDTGWNIYLTDTLSLFLLPKNANDSIVGTGEATPYE